jgi:hypothetical protein
VEISRRPRIVIKKKGVPTIFGSRRCLHVSILVICMGQAVGLDDCQRFRAFRLVENDNRRAVIGLGLGSNFEVPDYKRAAPADYCGESPWPLWLKGTKLVWSHRQGMDQGWRSQWIP